MVVDTVLLASPSFTYCIAIGSNYTVSCRLYFFVLQVVWSDVTGYTCGEESILCKTVRNVKTNSAILSTAEWAPGVSRPASRVFSLSLEGSKTRLVSWYQPLASSACALSIPISFLPFPVLLVSAVFFPCVFSCWYNTAATCFHCTRLCMPPLPGYRCGSSCVSWCFSRPLCWLLQLFVPLPFPLSCNCCLLWFSSSLLTQSSLLSRLITTPCVARLGSLLSKSCSCDLNVWIQGRDGRGNVIVDELWGCVL